MQLQGDIFNTEKKKNYVTAGYYLNLHVSGNKQNRLLSCHMIDIICHFVFYTNHTQSPKLFLEKVQFSIMALRLHLKYIYFEGGKTL